MSDIQNALRERAKALLTEGKVKCFIGWGPTRFPERTIPKFVVKPEDADQLVYNDNCLNTLAKYTIEFQFTPDTVVGLAARGCEARAINRLIADKRLSRSKVYIVGIPCSGMKENGKTAEKCQYCRHRNPVVHDEMIGQPVAELENQPRFEQVLELENKSPDDRYAFWQQQFGKCIRCYACRNVCPACNCMECYTDQYRTGWMGKQANTVENAGFGFTRAYHIGDRCIECGECERVCPMGLPLMKLNRKLVKDVDALFGSEETGLSDDASHALGCYSKEDVEEFM